MANFTDNNDLPTISPPSSPYASNTDDGSTDVEPDYGSTLTPSSQLTELLPPPEFGIASMLQLNRRTGDRITQQRAQQLLGAIGVFLTSGPYWRELNSYLFEEPHNEGTRFPDRAGVQLLEAYAEWRYSRRIPGDPVDDDVNRGASPPWVPVGRDVLGVPESMTVTSVLESDPVPPEVGTIIINDVPYVETTFTAAHFLRAPAVEPIMERYYGTSDHPVYDITEHLKAGGSCNYFNAMFSLLSFGIFAPGLSNRYFVDYFIDRTKIKLGRGRGFRKVSGRYPMPTETLSSIEECWWVVRLRILAVEFMTETPAKPKRKDGKLVRGEDSWITDGLESQILQIASRMGFSGVREENEMGGEAWVAMVVEVSRLPFMPAVVRESINRYEPSVLDDGTWAVRLFDQHKRFYWFAVDVYLFCFFWSVRQDLQAAWNARMRDPRFDVQPLAGGVDLESLRVRERQMLEPYHPQFLPAASFDFDR